MLLGNALCECLKALTATRSAHAAHLVMVIKDHLFAGRDKLVARTSKGAKGISGGPPLLRCCALASVLAAALRRVQWVQVRAVCARCVHCMMR